MWGEEIQKYLGMSVQVIRSSTNAIVGTDAIVTTYDLATAIKGKLIETYHGEKAVLINDESHNINGTTAKRTKAVFGEVLDLKGGIAEQFDQVWNLTGTPMTAYADGMYTQAAILHPEVFGAYKAATYLQFEKMFTYRKQKQYNKTMQPVWKISGNINEGFLNRVVYKELGAIRRVDTAGLPPVRHRDLDVPIKLTAEVRKALNGMKAEQVASLINDPESMIAKVWHTIGLLKVADTLPYLGECAKVGPVLVGIWHRDVGQAYYDGLTAHGFRAAQVNGSTKDNDKEKIRDDFNSGRLDVLIGQMGAMGVSWNLQQASSHVVITEEYPSATVVEQFYKRVARLGQTQSVQVDYIGSDTLIDTALRSVRLRKAKSNEAING